MVMLREQYASFPLVQASAAGVWLQQLPGCYKSNNDAWKVSTSFWLLLLQCMMLPDMLHAVADLIATV